MPLFGTSSPFDQDVEKITNEKNTTEDWGLIMDFCDRVSHARDGPKDALRAIMKRVQHQNPHVALQAVTLLDACANNAGRQFRLEVASRDFETDYKKALSKGHPKVQERLKLVLRGWAEGDFRDDPQLALIPSLYQQLRRSGIDFSKPEQQNWTPWGRGYTRTRRKQTLGETLNKLGKTVKKKGKNPSNGGQARQAYARGPRYSWEEDDYERDPMRDYPKQRNRAPKDPNVVASQQEEDDIAKAIQMSLQETKASPQTRAAAVGPGQQQTQMHQQLNLAGGGGLYPAMAGGGAAAAPTSPIGFSNGATNAKDAVKARALYDFEAAEDNELTFKAGEIVMIIDKSDQNWWKGSNHRGEGLFPANFVTLDLQTEPEQFKEEKRRRSVQFNDSVEVQTLKRDEEEEEQERRQQQAKLGPVRIDEDKIDKVLNLLHDADPTSEETDPAELVPLETHVNEMGPLIDNELEGVDRRLAQLTRLSTELVDALNLYHQLMREMPATPTSSVYGYAGYAPPPPQGMQPMGPPLPASYAHGQPPMYSQAGGMPPQAAYSSAPPVSYMSPPPASQAAGVGTPSHQPPHEHQIGHQPTSQDHYQPPVNGVDPQYAANWGQSPPQSQPTSSMALPPQSQASGAYATTSMAPPASMDNGYAGYQQSPAPMAPM